jgi:signal transduction histidine kinase
MGVGTQIRLLALALVLATATLLGVVTWWSFDKLVGDVRRESLDRLTRTSGDRLEGSFTLLRRDAELIAMIPAVRRYAMSGGEDELRRMGELLTQLSRGRPFYSTLRIVGVADNGREVLRVDRDGDTVTLVPNAELQPIGDLPFFREAIATPIGSYFRSRVELDREHGKIVVPHRPTVRATVPLAGADGGVWGIVVISVDFGRLVDFVLPDRRGERTVRIASEDGDYLIHEDDDRAFGFEFGKRHRVQDDAPPTAPLFGAGARAGDSIVLDWPGKEHALAQFRRLGVETVDFGHPIVFGIISTPAALAANTSSLVQRALVVTAILLLLAMAMGYFGSWVVAKPIRRIGAAARAFAKGDSPRELPTARNDEIGDLARAFVLMTESLRTKQAELTGANHRMEIALRDLDHFAHVAAHDLREPARRMTALADLIDRRERERLSEDGRHHIDRMRLAADAMLQQITAFRELVDLRQSDPVRSMVDLDATAKAVVAELAAELAGAGFTARVEPLPSLLAYEHLVPVLFRKLVQHAVTHARAARATLVFSAENALEGPLIKLRVTMQDGNVARAIPAYTALAVDALSADLGLAIAKRIAERHSGRLDVLSGENHVEFSFTFGSHAEVS